MIEQPAAVVREPAWSRRRFLEASAAALGTAALASTATSHAEGLPRKRLRVAAIFTAFFRRSHAFNILENFLESYLFNGKRIDPGMDVVSFYADQFPASDMAREVAKRSKIPLYKTIPEALCLGKRELAVDAVLSIGEHGTYPVTKLGQVEYPRKRFFDESVAVMRRSRRFVPFFNDKHLSYRWDWAQQMYEVARKLGIPLMAGSSVPLAQRWPTLEVPVGTAIAEAVAIHGGGVESYDFHGFEVLQSLVEFRKGGETGIASVEFLRGEALWKAATAKRWSLALAEAALAAEFGKKIPNLRQIKGEKPVEPHGLLLTYQDGLKALVLKLGTKSTRWNFAYRSANEAKLQATSFYTGPWGNRNLFQALAHAIQEHFRQRRAPYAVERTLLATGVVEAAVRSRAAAGKSILTPHLHFAYKARDFRALRETGATWKIITDKTPEPLGMNPGRWKAPS
jgi:hypothetical protein